MFFNSVSCPEGAMMYGMDTFFKFNHILRMCAFYEVDLSQSTVSAIFWPNSLKTYYAATESEVDSAI